MAVLHREEFSPRYFLLKTIGKIVKGRTDSVLAADSAYPLLAKFLAYSYRPIVKEAAAIVSRIAAVNAVEVQDLITNNVTSSVGGRAEQRRLEIQKGSSMGHHQDHFG